MKAGNGDDELAVAIYYNSQQRRKNSASGSIKSATAASRTSIIGLLLCV